MLLLPSYSPESSPCCAPSRCTRERLKKAITLGMDLITPADAVAGSATAATELLSIALRHAAQVPFSA